MYKYLIAAVFLTFQSYSQSTVFMKNGVKVEIVESSFKVLPKSRRVVFENQNQAISRVKFKEIDSVKVGNLKFEVLKFKRKHVGFYKLAKTDARSLYGISMVKSRPAGGFEIPYKHFEIVILDGKSAEVLYKRTFTDEDNANAETQRNEALKIIKELFNDCASVLERLSAIEAVVNTEDRIIEEFIKVPVQTLCN